MKKGLLFIAALVLTNMTAFAQVDNTLQFVDAAGNVVENGATVNGILEHKSDPMNGDYVQVNSGLYVKNNKTSEDVYAQVLINLTRMDNGKFSCCYPGQCGEIESPTTTNTSPAKAGEQSVRDFMTEWFPTAYGQCQATFTLQIMEMYTTEWMGVVRENYKFKANGPSVTVNFVYSDPTGIDGVTVNEDNGEATYFTIDGRKLNAPQKGLNIIRYANGKTIKKIIK